MASTEITPPIGWVVRGRLHDAEFPELLNDLMIEVTHPQSDVLIYAGWHPEEDPSGAYVVGVIKGCNFVDEYPRIQSPYIVERVISTLANFYGPTASPRIARVPSDYPSMDESASEASRPEPIEGRRFCGRLQSV